MVYSKSLEVVAWPRDSGVDSKLLSSIENEGDLQW